MDGRQKDAAISDPTPVGRSCKCYTIRSLSFEVPNHFNVTKALGFLPGGIVCSAIDSRTDERVSIKKLTKIFAQQSARVVVKELKILSHLGRHDNLISIKDLFRPRVRDFEDLYFVSEVMDTQLHQVIRSKQKLTDEHHQYFIYQILRALHYVHSAQIVHGNLKPDNLLVNSNCDLRICDFGSAKGANEPNDKSTEEPNPICRWYKAPEVLLAANYGPPSDIWSTGCIFVELITRKPFFPGKNYLEQFNLITDVLGAPGDSDLTGITSEESLKYLRSMPKKRPVPFSDLLPSCNKLALDFLEKMLVFDPKKRMTAEQALAHPYLSTLHEPNDELPCEKAFDWATLPPSQASEQELREAVWQEILALHPTDPEED